ncbi:hypothetical protein AB205_0186550, partial [Aquarana catesbeiana]
MEDPLILLDGSSSKDASERCPQLSHSPDSKLEDLGTPHQSENQINVEEDRTVQSDEEEEEEVPPEISTDISVKRTTVERRPLPIFSLKRDGRKWQRIRIKSEINLEVREEDTVEEQKDRPFHRNTPERFPSPVLSDNSDADYSQQDLQEESPEGGPNGAILLEEDLYLTDEQEMKEDESTLDFDAAAGRKKRREAGSTAGVGEAWAAGGNVWCIGRAISAAGGQLLELIPCMTLSAAAKNQ